MKTAYDLIQNLLNTFFVEPTKSPINEQATYDQKLAAFHAQIEKNKRFFAEYEQKRIVSIAFETLETEMGR
jgi:hypothetical protein